MRQEKLELNIDKIHCFGKNVIGKFTVKTIKRSSLQFRNKSKEQQISIEPRENNLAKRNRLRFKENAKKLVEIRKRSRRNHLGYRSRVPRLKKKFSLTDPLELQLGSLFSVRVEGVWDRKWRVFISEQE